MTATGMTGNTATCMTGKPTTGKTSTGMTGISSVVRYLPLLLVGWLCVVWGDLCTFPQFLP